MKILAVDTSTRHLSIAVTDGDKALVAHNARPRKDLSLTITFDIEHALEQAGIVLHNIDGFVVGLGPGSFTSLRVGMSMMKAFIMVTEKPVVGISSLDAIAMNVKAHASTQVCVINDARRNLLYSAIYEKKDTGLTRKSEYLLKPIDEVLVLLQGETVFIGDGIQLYRDHITAKAHEWQGRFTPHFETDKHWLPHAKELARLGYQRFLRGETDKIDTLAPLYLYPQDCMVSTKKSAVSSQPSAGKSAADSPRADS
ncbi:MAG: tRNA (adenosine(37)-N6)-threonylcarbamoyltransferase complex dimerization subunit type 1 TsaB [Candidatus Omnitrophica bacterium]|nr:tRNA (adenosine(37)-N6)-threonylcarbamoyltransferase complex dimerization subunit type 1 TsaB [Candidatus Omnitrophota bacterium]